MFATTLNAFLRACRRNGIVPTRFLFAVNIARQTAFLLERSPRSMGNNGGNPLQRGFSPGYALRKTFRCSTSRFGIGEKAGSNMTPRGLHRVAQKVGGGWPAGTVFKGRQPVGFTWQGMPDALITTRIFWLEGLETGFNRGGNVDSYSRYIYIHGSGNPLTLGRPASHGCTHLADHELIPLYEMLPVGALVWITER